jgi:Flp pilus assembly protein TadD
MALIACQLNAGDPEGALLLLHRYLTAYPKDLTALMARGTAHALTGRMEVHSHPSPSPLQHSSQASA